MTRQDMLEIAAKRPAINKMALSLARQFTTKEAVDQACEAVERSVAKMRIWGPRVLAVGLGSLVLFMAIVIVMNILIHQNVVTRTTKISALVTVGVLLAVCLIGAFIWCEGEHRYKQKLARLALLRPIAGMDACQQALAYVEKGYPSVVAWRDLAVAERYALSGFDVEILRCLHDMAEQAVAQSKVQKSNDEACRKLHGLQVSNIV